jgi:sortase A
MITKGGSKMSATEKTTKTATAFITAVLVFAAPVCAVSAATYNVAGAKEALFGSPSSTDPVTVVPVNTNPADRSKNSQIIPPPFASPDRDVPVRGTPDWLTPHTAGNISSAAGSVTGVSALSSAYLEGYAPASNAYDYENSRPLAFTKVTSDLYYPDGTLGRADIPAIGLSVAIYEGESLDSIAKGAGHFTSTSIWDGNVGLAGHNRGQSYWFGDIHLLRPGDKIFLSVKLGDRTYVVSSVRKIEETDFTPLERSAQNRITLVTCVKNESTKRWVVIAEQEVSI